MTPLIEQRLRLLLARMYDEGYCHGLKGGTSSFRGDECVADAMAEVWKLLTYHASRGDAAQDYCAQFQTGDRDWKEFRWNEVWDRMHAVGPFRPKQLSAPRNICRSCGERFEGDGYTKVTHCPNASEESVDCVEPDANPVHCSGGSLE